MKNIHLNPYALGCVALAMLAGCGGSRPPTAIPQGASNVVQVGRSQSSFDSPKKVAGGYLYVSNYQYDEIVLYRYDPKTMTLAGIGQISPQSIRTPLGSCSDARGNVYVVGGAGTGDTGAIVELAFGTVTVMQTLSDDSGPPSGCSVDPTTGNLAVTNQSSYYTNSYHLAQVLIYKNGSGTPEQINACAYNGTAGYDPKGNLWLECENKEIISIEKLPKGGSSFQPVTFDETYQYVGAIQWDGKYLDVSFGSVNNTNLWTMGIYQTAISGSTLTTVHAITFQRGPKKRGGRGCNSGLIFSQWAMISKKADDLPTGQGKQLLAANEVCKSLDVWKYPAGNRPERFLNEPVKYKDYEPNSVTYVTQP
jgi:hypothetical protein